MKEIRWLLPFTCKVDMQAIDAVVRLAESGHATLVAVSLIAQEKPDKKGPRLEYIQQSQDFLEALYYRSLRFKVPLERHEIISTNIMQSLTTLPDELNCNGMVLVQRGGQEALLHASYLKDLVTQVPVPLLLIHLNQQQSQKNGLIQRLVAWLLQYLESGSKMRATPASLPISSQYQTNPKRSGDFAPPHGMRQPLDHQELLVPALSINVPGKTERR